MNHGNFELTILSKGKENLERIFSIFFDENTNLLIEGFSLENNEMRLYTYFDANTKAVKFPFKMNKNAILDFVWHWLNSKEARSSLGSKYAGFDGTIKNDAWFLTTKKCDYNCLFYIKPEISEYHK